MRTHVLALLAAPCIALGMFTLATDSNAAVRRNYVSGNYLVEVDGQSGGFVSKVAGGGVSSTVAIDKAGALGSYPKKRVGPTQFDDITFSVGVPEGPLMEWIKAAVNTARSQKKDGAIVAGDMNFKEVSRMSWKGGFLSEVSFPELDATQAKTRWEMDVTITPDSTSFAANAGSVITKGVGAKSKAAPTTALFRMAIPGLDLKRVMKIEEISVRYHVVAPTEGEQLRAHEKTPGTVDVSNLIFEMPEATDAMQLYVWYQTFVKGGGVDKKTATIELLSQDLKTVLVKLTLNGVGIAKVSPVGVAGGNNETSRKVRAEAFVESVLLELR